MSNFGFSKSKYCRGAQCPKMLWLEKNMSHAAQPVDNASLFKTGNEVGNLARGLFGEYEQVPYNAEDYDGMIAATKDLLGRNVKNICEAAFSYDGCFCAVDILKNLGGNKVEIYEVKSSSDVKPIYAHDVSYQYYVLTKAGFEVTKACLVYMNNKYVRKGELEIEKLFAVEDFTKIAKEKFDEVEQRVADLRKYLENKTEPEYEIGMQCRDPYECAFCSYCRKAIPQGCEGGTVFDIAGMDFKDKTKLYNQGFVTFEQLYANGLLKGKKYQQVEFELKNLPPQIEKKEIKKFLETIKFPLYFLDFESFQPAVPPYENSRPFQQIVFQYSLHYIEKEGGELRHKEFLAYPGKDPRRALAEQLCKDIPLDVCTTAYSMSFEKTRIKELAELYPDLHDHLMNIHGNIRDLMVPFQKRWYYAKEMAGSYSIKKVLPALCPNAPELDYHNLEGVHNGTEASAAFLEMQNMSGEELEKKRGYLLKYCGLDTFAMVKVWEKLKCAARRVQGEGYRVKL